MGEALDGLGGHIHVGEDGAVALVVTAGEDQPLVNEDTVLGDEVDDLGFPDLGIVFEGVQADQVLDGIGVDEAIEELGPTSGLDEDREGAGPVSEIAQGRGYDMSP